MGSVLKSSKLPFPTAGYTNKRQSDHACHKQHCTAAMLKAYGPGPATGSAHAASVGVVAVSPQRSVRTHGTHDQARSTKDGKKETHNLERTKTNIK